VPPWIFYTIATVVLFGGWGLVSKMISSSSPLSAWQIEALSTIGMIPVIALLAIGRESSAARRSRRGLIEAFAAGMLSAAGNVAYIEALARGGKAAAVVPLTALYPVVTIVLALIFLGERVGKLQILGIVLSLVAIWCFNITDEAALSGPSDGTAFVSPWIVVSLIPIALWGISALLQKIATGRAGDRACTLSFLVGFLPLSVAVVAFQGLPSAISNTDLGLSALLGFFFALGNLTLILAYGRGGKASIVTPAAGLYSLVTIPLAILILEEQIGVREGLGIGAALLGVLALCQEAPPATRPAERPASSAASKEQG
jgi:transporter family protein